MVPKHHVRGTATTGPFPACILPALQSLTSVLSRGPAAIIARIATLLHFLEVVFLQMLGHYLDRQTVITRSTRYSSDAVAHLVCTLILKLGSIAHLVMHDLCRLQILPIDRMRRHHRTVHTLPAPQYALYLVHLGFALARPLAVKHSSKLLVDNRGPKGYVNVRSYFLVCMRLENRHSRNRGL